MTLSFRHCRPALKVEANDEAIVVRLVGRGASLNEKTAPMLSARLDGLAAERGRRRLVLDFTNVELVSSTALTTLLRVRKQVQAADGSVVLRNLQDTVHEVFEVTRLAGLFELEWRDDAAAGSAPAGDGHAATVLVVDDAEPVRSVLDRALRGQGLEVLQAARGKDGLELYRRDPGAVAVVLLDVQMPGWSGPDTFEALRAVDPRVCCCFMSGDLGRYSEEDLFRLGAAEVFEKPFRLDDVVQTVLDLAGHDEPLGTGQAR
jgi:anti-anti-sigma factor